MLQGNNQEVNFKFAIIIHNIEDSIQDSEHKMTSEEMLSVTCCKAIIGFGVRTFKKLYFVRITEDMLNQCCCSLRNYVT